MSWGAWRVGVALALAAALSLPLRAELVLKKCCGVREALDASGERCVAAAWAQDTSLRLHRPFAATHVHAPHDARWLNLWLPPGLDARELDARGALVWACKGYPLLAAPRRVHTAALADANSTLAKDVVLFDDAYVWRPRRTPPRVIAALSFSPAGGFRRADYCVDAAPPPLGPFVVRLWTYPSLGDRVFKCCLRRRLLAARPNGAVSCARDPRAGWSPLNSSIFSRIDPEMPYDSYPGYNLAAEVFRIHLKPTEDDFMKTLVGRYTMENWFSTWVKPCADFYRDGNGNVHEVLGYRYYSRPARGAYWLSRNFPFVAILVLMGAMASVAYTERMRQSVHGWSMACHASCLLLFNVSQVLYYHIIGDEIDEVKKLPDHLIKPCLVFGFTSYFLLTAAGCWLTAVCINMALGFRLRQRTASRASRRRAFAWLSTFAWGAPAALTASCVGAWVAAPDDVTLLPWFQPTLMETRTCFLEMRRDYALRSSNRGASVKWGTLLYFYGPMCALVAANVMALALTARRVHYLRRGSSLLRRDEVETAVDAARRATPTGSDPQSLVVYLKLLLSAGAVEMVTEAVAWVFTSYNDTMGDSDDTRLFAFLDHSFAFRTAGSFADLLRAVIVLWLCAPDRAALRALWRRLRGGAKGGARAQKL